MTGDRLLLWDFDGTLAYREGMWSGALHAALAEVGITTVGIDSLRAGLQAGFPWHEPESGHEHLGDAEMWWDALLPVLTSASVRAGVDEDTSRQASRLVRTIYLDPASWILYEDSAAALIRAKELGWRNAILSNHVPELERLVGELGLADHLEAVITSAKLGWEKPNTIAFDRAVRSLGSPSDVVMVGDSRRADVDGAVSAGLRAVLVERVRNEDRVLIDLVTHLDQNTP